MLQINPETKGEKLMYGTKTFREFLPPRFY
jgi:hypothetical protein